jgi:hypothetical protein
LLLVRFSRSEMGSKRRQRRRRTALGRPWKTVNRKQSPASGSRRSASVTRRGRGAAPLPQQRRDPRRNSPAARPRRDFRAAPPPAASPPPTLSRRSAGASLFAAGGDANQRLSPSSRHPDRARSPPARALRAQAINSVRSAG